MQVIRSSGSSEATNLSKQDCQLWLRLESGQVSKHGGDCLAGGMGCPQIHQSLKGWDELSDQISLIKQSEARGSQLGVARFGFTQLKDGLEEMGLDISKRGLCCKESPVNSHDQTKPNLLIPSGPFNIIALKELNPAGVSSLGLVQTPEKEQPTKLVSAEHLCAVTGDYHSFKSVRIATQGKGGRNPPHMP